MSAIKAPTDNERNPMNMTSTGRAAVAGSSALAALLLTSCGAPALTAGEDEIKISKEIITSLESEWDVHRASQPASNTDGDSGCYIGGVDGALSGTAFCGPVRYLGQDLTNWDEIQVDATDREGKPSLASRGPFKAVDLQESTDLIRHDGQDAARDAQVQEPAAVRTAEPLEVFTSNEKLPPVADALSVELPRGELAVTAAAIRERAGSAADRTAAPEGFRMASVSFDTEDIEDAEVAGGVKLAFMVDGTAYPYDGAVDGGTLSIAVPEDSEASFAVTYDEVVQTVSVPEMELDAGDASSLYVPAWETTVIEEEIRGKASWVWAFANRFAHVVSPDLGWAGKDQVWISASTELGSAGEFAWKKDAGMKIVSAVMTDSEGAPLEMAEARVSYWDSHLRWHVEAFYKAPADTGETTWTVTTEDGKGNVYVSGPMTMGNEK